MCDPSFDFIYVKGLHVFKITYWGVQKEIFVYDENDDIIYMRHGCTLKQFEEMCKPEKRKTLEKLI